MGYNPPIALETNVTVENFDEELYLLANPDVAAAVTLGEFVNGRAHFDAFGHSENRKVRFRHDLIATIRAQKMEVLRPFLRDELPFSEHNGQLNYLSDELRKATRIIDTDRVSSNSYDTDTLGLIDKYKDGIVLDCGAGRRDVYHSNVINFEIVPYDTTDIVGVGECLPFKDDTFDAVLSIAVLEHVRDPFLCAREIIRVLKPGGDLFCAVPFLQPMHGYPHHYFNATRSGLTSLFEDSLDIDRVFIPDVGHPSYTLHWFLASWATGLRGVALQEFRHLTVDQILQLGPANLASSPAGCLPEAQADELACSFVLTARKPLG